MKDGAAFFVFGCYVLPTRPFAPKDASISPSGLQGRESAARRAPKLLVSNCQTSAEKSGNFTAEVGEVLLSVFLTPRIEVIFLLVSDKMCTFAHSYLD